MLQFKSLTNLRPTKDLGNQIIASPTEGQFKVTPDAASALNVVTGDYLQLVEAGGQFYAVKGKPGFGGKIGAASKVGAGTLNFSGAKAWDDMGGDTGYNTSFDINTESSVVQMDEKFGEERTYFLLESAGREAKQSRKKKGTSENIESTNDMAVEAVETVEAQTEETSSFDDI